MDYTSGVQYLNFPMGDNSPIPKDLHHLRQGPPVRFISDIVCMRKGVLLDNATSVRFFIAPLER